MSNPSPQLSRSNKLSINLVSIVIGLVYGIFARLIFSAHWDKTGPFAFLGRLEGLTQIIEPFFPIMSLSFIFLVPFALGFLTVYQSRGLKRSQYFIVPWVPTVLCLGAALLFAWEGLICIYLWIPLFLMLSSLGGMLGGFLREIIQNKSKTTHTFVFALMALLPFIAAPLESQFASPQDFRIVQTQIEIEASPEIVWQNIREVPAIQDSEQFFSWVHFIGFPKPDEAQLIGEGVGAVRHATFKGGVLFYETVTRWEEGKALAFTIKADSNNIPAKTLDQHVTVGGPYFDVLDGSYEIQVLAPGRVVLHLASTHRLSTHFNFYAGFWTDFVMRDTQEYILKIIKKRCESQKALAIAPSPILRRGLED